MHVEPSRRRDLPEGQSERVRSGRERQLLPARVLRESVVHRQALSGPQNALLRRDAVLFLCGDGVRRPGLSRGRVFQQGEMLGNGVQSRVYHDAAAASAKGVRAFYDPVLVRAEQDRAEGRESGEAAVGSGTYLVS